MAQANARVKLHATYLHPRAAGFQRPGGPWDTESLDVVLHGHTLVDLSAGAPFAASELEAMTATVAGGLRSRGVGRGDVVAWQAPNWYEVVVLYRACWRLGAVAAPIHHLAGAAEVERMLSIVDPRVWLSRDDVRGDAFARLLDSEPVTHGAAEPSDLAVALFTAGSTGVAKAALHTHRGLAYKARVMAHAHGLTGADAILMPAPLAHISGLLNAVLLPGVVGMTAVLMEKWDPNRALEVIQGERISFMIGPPTFFVTLMSASNFTRERVASLRLVSSGGAGVTPSFVAAASEALGCRVKRTYGSTEAPTITTSMPNDPVERARETDGRVVSEAELRIADTGELWLRGPELFVGYAEDEQTRAAITDGWFRTGDLATVDDDGWLTITGRMKDVIIRAGENISASEVEAVLEAHPAVRQAVVVGTPDDRLGEQVCAFVVSDEPFDLEMCRVWFEQQGIARYKAPERVVQVDELPLLAAGKPDRAALRARAAQTSMS